MYHVSSTWFIYDLLQWRTLEVTSSHPKTLNVETEYSLKFCFLQLPFPFLMTMCP
jgi:hypothetical protein